MTVTLQDAKAHLNITFDNDDGVIQRMLDAARSFMTLQIGHDTINLSTDPQVDQAILMLTAHYYANREATMVGVSAAALPFGVQEIIDNNRSWSWSDE